MAYVVISGNREKFVPQYTSREYNIVKNSSNPDEIAALATHQSSYIRTLVTQNPHTSEKTLRAMIEAFDADPDVRRALSRNVQQPELLALMVEIELSKKETLAKDLDPEVRNDRKDYGHKIILFELAGNEHSKTATVERVYRFAKTDAYAIDGGEFLKDIQGMLAFRAGREYYQYENIPNWILEEIVTAHNLEGSDIRYALAALARRKGKKAA